MTKIVGLTLIINNDCKVPQNISIMLNTLISIIIPTFNRAQIISETLDSVLAQTYKNWECIIVDDGSSDNTEEVVLAYTSKDHRFKFYKRPSDYPPGGNGARNYGFEISNGTYINWFDSDDLMHPKKLETQINAFTTEHDFVACFGRHFGSNEDELIIKDALKDPLYDYFFNSHSFPTPSILWRKYFLADKALFSEKLVIYQELEFHYRILTFRPKYHVVKEELYSVRRGHQSIVTNRSKPKFKYSTLYCFSSKYKLTKKVNDLPIPLKKKMLNYLCYRITSASFVIMADLSIKERLSFLSSHLDLIKGFKRHMSFFKYSKLFLGYIFFALFNKGYNIFLPREFDYRK